MVDMKVHAVGTKRGAMCGRLHDQRTVLFSLAGTFWQAGFPQLNALASCSLLLSPAMDPQLHEYRAAQQARFEEAKAELQRRVDCGGPLRPSTCAEALARQLRARHSDLPHDRELQSAVLRWALLSQLGSEEWGASAAQNGEAASSGGGWLDFLQLMPCLGGMGRPLPGVPSELPALGPLLRCDEAPGQMSGALVIALLASDPTLLSGGWPLQLAVAAALCDAEGETDQHFHSERIDMVQRYYSFRRDVTTKKLFQEFQQLRAWHFRYILGSWHSDADLAWSRDAVEQQYRQPDAIGRSARMVKYKPHNDKGVSVQEGLRFYDGQITTMPVILDYGGVCGAVSKFGTSCCQAFGVPAMPVAQPGHCALIWRGPLGRWELENDCGGWNQSRMHDGIQRTWHTELGELCQEAGIIPVFERALQDCETFRRCQALRLASELLAPELAFEAFQLRAEAVAQCPWDLSAWAAWLKTRPFPVAALRERTEAAEAAAAWPGGRRNLSRSRPVRASVDDDRAQFVVDGTDSEWFPADSADPQWLEIDLEQVCQVHEVRVKWWGDYGSRNTLRVLSLLQDDGFEGTDDEGVFVERGRRLHNADFNGWTELPGWQDPTRILRFEVGNPCPDCFGLKKSYGIRRIEVLGRCAEGGQTPEALLLRLAEASFPDLEDLPHQQALRLVRKIIKSSGITCSGFGT
ncbi:ME1 [Symbiodinium natans]|uniref:ME1 protein n=1 Tax=Symbiodinium natans TaxID=878477 RepID=A0A812S7I5_9DINO|nr:ME1 [Symbiodinium natans]